MKRSIMGKPKTEHAGAKHGKGAFHGRKQEAKECSNKNRRQLDRMLANGDFESFEDYED